MGSTVVDWRSFSRIEMRMRSFEPVHRHLRRYRRSSSKGLITHWMSILKCQKKIRRSLLRFSSSPSLQGSSVNFSPSTNNTSNSLSNDCSLSIRDAPVTYRNESSRCRSLGIIDLKLVWSWQDKNEQEEKAKHKSVFCSTRNNWHERRKEKERTPTTRTDREWTLFYCLRRNT